MEQKKLTLQQEFDIHGKNFGVEDYTRLHPTLLIYKFKEYIELDAVIGEKKKIGRDVTDEVVEKTLIGSALQAYFEKKKIIKDHFWLGVLIGLCAGFIIGGGSINS